MPVQELRCAYCWEPVTLTEEELVYHKDVQCPSCKEWNEVHASTGSPPKYMKSYRLERKGE